MYIYGIAKVSTTAGLTSYGSIARAGWKALKDNEITADGRFTNVCVGTGISNDLPFI